MNKNKNTKKKQVHTSGLGKTFRVAFHFCAATRVVYDSELRWGGIAIKQQLTCSHEVAINLVLVCTCFGFAF